MGSPVRPRVPGERGKWQLQLPPPLSAWAISPAKAGPTARIHNRNHTAAKETADRHRVRHSQIDRGIKVVVCVF